MDKQQLEEAMLKRISKRHFDYIFMGKRRPSPELAEEFERLTGIDRAAWIWPKRYGNPMLRIDAFATKKVKRAS
jgi:hypothetical protein